MKAVAVVMYGIWNVQFRHCAYIEDSVYMSTNISNMWLFPVLLLFHLITLQVCINKCLTIKHVHVQVVILHVCLSTQNPVTISENCANGQDIRASYELSYTTDSGTPITTCVVNRTDCSNGRCRHELQNNTADSRCQPPVSQLNDESVTVSLTARNIVGESNTSESRSLSEF